MTKLDKTPLEHPIREREKEILSAAAQLFAQEGFEAVAVRNIAEAVGLSKATLYHYFKDKDEIYARIVIDVMERLCLYVEEATTSGTTARERIVLYMEAHARFFEENIWTGTAMLLGLGGLQQSHDREQAAYWRDRDEHFLRQLISEGVASGEFKQVDPVITGRAILSTLNWMARWFKPDGPRRAPDFAHEYANLFLNGFSN